jgi:ubiquinone/menaquinone biosynthesis C-methylase UbiE
VDVWERIYKVIATRLEEEDKSFELAFLRFGGARKWLVEQANLNPRWMILDIGYGQGYLTIELASALTRGKVIGVDHLHEAYTIGATQWIANQVGVQKERMTLISSDSTRLPFKNATFDAVVSFLALQDIKATRGIEGVLSTLGEACRVTKYGGIVSISDDSFPCCRPKGDQGRIFDAIKQYWHNLLPSEKELIRQLKKNGVSDAKVLLHEANEKLPPRDAERELMLSVEGARQLGVNVDFNNFWKEAGDLIRKQGRSYSRVAVLFGTKTERR